MRTISDIVRAVLPDGSNGNGNWDELPCWPPDLFALAAYIAQQSDCYTILVSGSATGRLLREQSSYFVELARKWQEYPPQQSTQHLSGSLLGQWWQKLQSSELTLSGLSANEELVYIVLAFLITADEASKGIGFSEGASAVGRFNWVAYFDSLMQKGIDQKEVFKKSSPYLTQQPHSKVGYESKPRETCGVFANSDLVCVHPKTRTPDVGCSVRSLSHHLSLHPGASRLKSYWYSSHHSLRARELQDNLDILLMPIPYQLEPGGFQPAGDSNNHSDNSFGEFEVKQGWVEAEQLQKTISILMDAMVDADLKMKLPDVIVFPELSLSHDAWEAIIRELIKRYPKISVVLIAGVLSQEGNDMANTARTIIIQDGHKVLQIGQQKHHRWRLTKQQIQAYGLYRKFNSVERSWWENHQITQREIHYLGFSHGSCLATLICEDLARNEPCQQSIRAVGPNLVVALLMDGPQLEQRWPGRYATTLADDPSSSVLTLTSLALVERSNDYFGTSRRTIALWKDSSSSATEIELPVGAAGVLLCLNRRKRNEHTLDGRADGGVAQVWELEGVLRVGNASIA